MRKAAISLVASTQAMDINFTTSTPCMNESLTIEEIWAQKDISLVIIMKKTAPEICLTAIGTAEVSITIDDKYLGFEKKF